MILSNKSLITELPVKLAAFLMLTVNPLGFSHAEEPMSLEALIESQQAIEIDSALEQTLEYNFSPVDRARLRKALSDYARNNDPEHIQIQKQRKAMRENLKHRFSLCDTDLDDSLDRQESTGCIPQIARHFSFVDVDEDSVITFEELELAQAKWVERRKAAEAKLEAQRIIEAEAEIKRKAAQPKESKQAAKDGRNPG